MKYLTIRHILFVLAIMVLIALIRVTYAQGDHKCQGNSCNNNGTPASAVVKGSRSIGVSGGDMDINDCLATHSFLFGLWQGTHTNPYCAAINLDRDGKYRAAAEMRCSTRKYRKVYGKGQSCIDAVIRTVPPQIEPARVVLDTDEDEDARYAEQQQEIEYAREERASLVGQIDYLTQQIERAPVTRSQIDSGAQRRAKSREAYEKALAEGTDE